MNPSLHRLQTDFQNYVLNGIGKQLNMPEILAEISNRYGLQADERLAIYYNAYRARLREALSAAFDKTHAYVGDDLFAELGAAYVEETPSHFRNVRWYGDRFPEFLARTLPDHPVVAELAAFEWVLGLSFDAADAPVFGADDLGSIQADEWECIGFCLQPSLRILPLQWNAVEIWLALEGGQAPPDAAQSVQPVEWLVWRKDLQPHFRSLNEHEARALHGLRQGLSFSDVCSIAANEAGEDDISALVAAWLQTWTSDAILAGVTRC